MSKISSGERRILPALDDKPCDVYDICDALKISPTLAEHYVNSLKRRGLVDRMYSEDQVSITPAGRTTLNGEEGNG